MTYLVDANILCEPTTPQQEKRVIEWLRQQERDLVVDPIILGEIRFGIHLLPPGSRRHRLEQWFEEGIRRIHCVPWEVSNGLRWAKLLADMRAVGRAMPVKDSLIAATALVHGLVVATRTARDFTHAGVKVVNPFEA